MLRAILPGLLACAAVLQAGDRMRIGLRLQTPPSMPSTLLAELVRETERHWKFPALELHWHHSKDKSDSFDNRVLIVRFRGLCSTQRISAADLDNPLGRTHVSDEQVLPFIEVDCNAISASLFSRERGSRMFLGKERYAHALAVVLTHEMVHALTASRGHGREGIMRPVLTPADLDEERISLAHETIENLQEALNVPLTEFRNQ